MSLQVWLPLRGDLNNLGLSNVSITAGSDVTVNNNGKIGKCYNFNKTTNGYLSFSTPLAKNISEFSICAWVNLNTDYVANNGFHLISFSQTYGRICISKDNAAVRVLLSNSGGTSGASASSNMTAAQLSAGIWNHYAITFQSGKLNIYINGILNSTTTLSIQNVTYTADNLIIGKHSSELPYGKINDFRLYDHALSAKEVEEISKGLILHYKLDALNPNMLAADQDLTKWNKESGISVAWDSTVNMYKVTDSSHTSSRWGIYKNIPLKANTTYTFSVMGMKIDQDACLGFGEGSSWPATAGTFTTTQSRLQKTITIGANDATARIYLHLKPVADGTNYGYFVAPRLIINSSNGNIVYDVSGYQNNGTIAGNIELSYPSSRYLYSTYIPSGNTDYITTNDVIGNPSDMITMNIWFKSSCTTPGSSYHEIFNHATASQYFEFAIYSTGYFRQGVTINGTRYVINGGSGLIDGNWHMLTVTYDGATIKRYIDGEIIASMNQTVSGTLTGANGKFMFGHYGPNTSYYAKEACLSDARIYATALTADQIKELYNTSMAIDSNGNIMAREIQE